MTAEYVDLYDSEGRPTGTRKARDDVHRDGDWHRSVALWIVRPPGSLILQRRSLSKDTYPGAFTATVSGHYAAGEQLDQVLRESQEEIGIPASARDLLPVCVWRSDDRPAPGTVDRELIDVFLWPFSSGLAMFSPDPAEVQGLAEVSTEGLRDLLDGAVAGIRAAWLPSGGAIASALCLTASDLVPMADYHRCVVRAALAYLAACA